MGVRMDLHGVGEIELRRESISVIERDRIPYEVWNLYINHGKEEGEGEHFSISIFVVKNQSLKLDEMNTANLHPDHPPVFKFGLHEGVGDPEDPEDKKILEEVPEESDLTSDLTDEELKERVEGVREKIRDERDGMDLLKEKVENEGDLTDEEMGIHKEEE